MKISYILSIFFCVALNLVARAEEYIYTPPVGIHPAIIAHAGLEPKVMESIARMQKELQDNPEWAANYFAQSNRNYDMHLGITEEEFKKINTAKKILLNDGTITVNVTKTTTEDITINFENPTSKFPLSQIQYIADSHTLKSDLGAFTVYKSVDTGPDTPFGIWRATQWELQLSDKAQNTLASISIYFGVSAAKKHIILLRMKGIIQGKSIDQNTVALWNIGDAP